MQKKLIFAAVVALAVFAVSVQGASHPADDEAFVDTRNHLGENPFLDKLKGAVQWAHDTLRHTWDSMKEVWHKTIRSVFGDTPFWDRTYEFEVPDKFKDMTFEEFATFSNGAVKPREPTNDEFLSIQNELSNYETPLPDSYNFFEKYPECTKKPWNQGSCGSCWAFSTAGAITHRLCKAIRDAGGLSIPDQSEKSRLAPQFLVSCADSDTTVAPAGSCKGGNVYSAYQWVGKNYLSQTACASYKSWDSTAHPEQCPKIKASCNAFNAKHKDKRAAIKVTVDNVKFVIGEEAIKRAIFERGPISVVMQTPSNFIGASGKGVFSRGNAPWLGNGAMHSYHAVILVGWGVEDVKGTKVPYWILENSWGDIYWSNIPKGNRGMLKVLRGKADDMHLEDGLHTEANVMILNDKGEKVSVADGWWKISQGNPAALSVRSFRLSNGDLDVDAVEKAAHEAIHEAKDLIKNEEK